MSDATLIWDKDLVYARPEGMELGLDLARPRGAEPLLPLIVCIHGGGWQIGEKESYHWALERWAHRGYAVATVDYRLAPLHKFPKQVQDVKAAVRYLRSRAGELGIDKDRVAAMGESAGAHLALMLGLMNPEDGLEGQEGDLGQSSKVQAVVNYFGVTDFLSWSLPRVGQIMLKQAMGKRLDGLIEDVVGTSDKTSSILALASPVHYVDPKDPPVLSFQGGRDYLVPRQQAEVLHEALRKAEVEETLVVLPREGHGFTPEGMEPTIRQAEEFLDRHLKGRS